MAGERYVISLSGKPGGPWEARAELCLREATHPRDRWVLGPNMLPEVRNSYLAKVRQRHPDAKLMRLVPTKLRSLRDAVVEAAVAADIANEHAADVCAAATDYPTPEQNTAVVALTNAQVALVTAVRALRAAEKGDRLVAVEKEVGRG